MRKCMTPKLPHQIFTKTVKIGSHGFLSWILRSSSSRVSVNGRHSTKPHITLQLQTLMSCLNWAFDTCPYCKVYSSYFATKEVPPKTSTKASFFFDFLDCGIY